MKQYSWRVRLIFLLLLLATEAVSAENQEFRTPTSVIPVLLGIATAGVLMARMRRDQDTEEMSN